MAAVAAATLLALPTPQVNRNDLQLMLAEATGALAGQINFGNIVQLATMDTPNPTNPPFDQAERRLVTEALVRATIIALGTCSFVLPYERYKKVAARAFLAAAVPNANAAIANDCAGTKACEVFDLERFNDAITLQATFPGTIVMKWDPDVIGATRTVKRSWFADVVRNSFAHAQTEYVPPSNDQGAAAATFVEAANAAAVAVTAAAATAPGCIPVMAGTTSDQAITLANAAAIAAANAASVATLVDPANAALIFAAIAQPAVPTNGRAIEAFLDAARVPNASPVRATPATKRQFIQAAVAPAPQAVGTRLNAYANARLNATAINAFLGVIGATTQIFPAGLPPSNSVAITASNATAAALAAAAANPLVLAAANNAANLLIAANNTPALPALAKTQANTAALAAARALFDSAANALAVDLVAPAPNLPAKIALVTNALAANANNDAVAAFVSNAVPSAGLNPPANNAAIAIKTAYITEALQPVRVPANNEAAIDAFLTATRAPAIAAAVGIGNAVALGRAIPFSGFVRMTNKRGGAAHDIFNFDIYMPEAKFEKLVATGLRGFTQLVLAPGVPPNNAPLQPIDKMLTLCLD